MELAHYIDILKRRALVIIIVTAVATLATVVVGILMPHIYKGKAMVRVSLDVGVLDLNLRVDYGESLLNTYSGILKSDPFLQAALGQLNPRPPSMTVADLREKVQVDVVPNTELISIVVQDRDSARARDLANILATLLVDYAQKSYGGSGTSARQILEKQMTDMQNELDNDRRQLQDLTTKGTVGAMVESLQSQIRLKEDSYNRLLNQYETARLNESLRANSVTIIEQASLPKIPANALGLKEVGLGLLLGFFGGAGLALVFENLDTRIHSFHQLEYLTNLPVLGVVPRGKLPLVNSHKDSMRPQAIEEAYRLLSTNLQALRQEEHFKTLLITSAVPQEGKSTVASGLSQTLAEWGQTVFLVESDLRRPTFEKLFGFQDGIGLSNLLTERDPLNSPMLSQVMHPTQQSCLFVMGGGPQVPNPTTLLAAPAMEKLLDHLGAQGQMTLLDAPPVLGMADVSILAPKVDGVIVIVSQARSSREDVRRAIKQLEAMRAHVLGLVFVQKSSKGWGYD